MILEHKSKTASQYKILIIDDDEGMSYTLARMVEEAGHLADAAFTLNEGLKKIMTLKDYQEYLEAIEWEDFFQIEKILKKYDIKMVVK